MHSFTLALLLALPSAAPLAGPTAGPPAGPPVVRPQTEAAAASDDRRAELIELIRAGELAAARVLLDDLLLEQETARAAELLAGGKPVEAIDAADAALVLEGRTRAERSTLWMLRGKAVMAAADAGLVVPAMYGEALENFEEAAATGAGVAAALRASTAARMIGANDEALELARAAVRFIDGGEGRAEGLDLDRHYARIWAESAFDAFIAAANSGASDAAATERRAALADETRAALERVVGDLPTDPWAYGQLGTLALWLGDADGAVAAAEAGVFAAPDSTAMHEALVSALVSRAQGAVRAQGLGDEEALEARFRGLVGRYGELLAKYPEKALFYWYPAVETYLKGARVANAGNDAREIFSDAEAFFMSAAERNPDYRDACVTYRVLCRNGRALSLANNEEKEAAVEVLLGVDELRPLADPAVTERGQTAALEVAQPGTMPSALALLSNIIQGLMRDPSDKFALTLAASIADRQFALRPTNANLANNAGFLNRDASMLWEAEARRALARAEDDAARDAALALRAKGQELIERSWEAYRVAAELVPDDVRVVNDAGLVMAYYIRTDPERAVQYFQDSIADGTAQVETARAMAPDTLALAGIDLPALTEAWGDAHENMGIVEWTFRRNPEKAREWFQKALEIGPPSRNWMKRQLLPLLDEWIETGERPKALDVVEARTVWVHNQP